MKSHWCVHMKNGQDMDFERKVHYIDSKDNVLYFMTDHVKKIMLAAIPIENILWIKSIEEEDE